MSTLPSVELGVLGTLQVRRDGLPVAIPGAKPRAILTMLGLHGNSVVSSDTLIRLLWGSDPPRTADKALQTHVSALRRVLDDGIVMTDGAGWTLAATEVDASRYKSAARRARDAAAAGDTGQAVTRFEEALALWRGIPELPDSQRGAAEKTRWTEGHAALVEDRADALLATGRAAEIIGDLEAAVGDAPLRERRWGQLMLALYRAGRQGEALGAYRRARSQLADELGVDPGPELRRLEAAIVAQDPALEMPAAQTLSSVTRAVTFLLTDIEGSTAAWEADSDAMAVALARHDEIVEHVVTSRGGRLIKTRGEGDATFSVFDRPSGAAAAAIELQDAITHEPWTLLEPMCIRVALHTGEVEFRDGDYFGRAVNRAARLRSLAGGGQILCSGATAELVIDSLSDDAVLDDLGMRQLRNLARPEHVFELRLQTADATAPSSTIETPIERPPWPTVLAGHGPFVGRGTELERLSSTWQIAVADGTRALLISGEPGVGKTRLAGEWSGRAYERGAVVIYGRCDEDLGAPYQPFAEALRSLVPCLGAGRLRGLRGIEALHALVPGLTDLLPDIARPARSDPDTERYALFDAVVAVLEIASAAAPVVLVLDDLHWAAKPTLLLLRHLLRFGEKARVQIIGTYRSTDLDRSHPLAAMLADLHRDGTADRLQLSGLEQDDVTAYVAEAGYDDEQLALALASVTGGNPFFLIEALRHVDESGGHWDPGTLPQGVREAVSRRLSRLPVETNRALAAAAVVGSRFAVALVELVVEQDLVDAFDEASKAGLLIEEPGGCYRFNHAIVRQSLLAELASVRRMRLHQRIATMLETMSGADDELLAELAHHYFECAWAGNAAKAVEYCRRAADQAMARLAYEGAADLFDHALHALEELDDELPDREVQATELLVARCEALLAAGDVTSAGAAVTQLKAATRDSARLTAWATCFDGELSMLVHPERLDDVETAVGAAADRLAELDDPAGEAKAQTVRAACLARLGRIGDCEIALDRALTAARRAREHRRVNAVLAGAPPAALWGPSPVPRAGGRCLDVVRLLRITTDSPAVEATSTRCQAVLEAYRGRAAAARRMIDSARRTVSELGLRHAVLEVEHFAGIVELIAHDPAAAEPHLRRAHEGFRRMGLDADTAEVAALLARTCLALDRMAEADELCSESEHLAGHALKAAIAWRTVRAQLLAHHGDHDEARRVAEAAVAMAERTDALVDHGDACLALATVLDAAGDTVAARSAAERALVLYEKKGAAALADEARIIIGGTDARPAQSQAEVRIVDLDNACVRVGNGLVSAVNREVRDHQIEQFFARSVSVESRRKVVGFPTIEIAGHQWPGEVRQYFKTGKVQYRHETVAVRGERLALFRLEIGTADTTPGAPQDEMFQVVGLDDTGRIARQVWFDTDDVDAAMAELDAVHATFENELPAAPLENAACRVFGRLQTFFTARDWDAMAEMLADDSSMDDRRRLPNTGARSGRNATIAGMRAIAETGVTSITSVAVATRGTHLVLCHTWTRAGGPEPLYAEALQIVEADAGERMVALVTFDLDGLEAAIEELETRYRTGEAAPYAQVWSVVTAAHTALNRHELPPTTTDLASVDHRRVSAFAPGEGVAYLRAGWDLDQDIKSYVETVHRLTDLGSVTTHAANGSSPDGFAAQWRGVDLLTVEGGKVNRAELYDEEDLEAALARFEELATPKPRLENATSRACDRYFQRVVARDWDAVGELLTDAYYTDDRRHVVGGGRYGRDAEITSVQAQDRVGVTDATATAIAVRGERLALSRVRYSGRDGGLEAFVAEVLVVFETSADGRFTAAVALDPADLEAAIAELDARYLAGEAAAHASVWSLISRSFAAFNRHDLTELPATTPDYRVVDRRLVGSIDVADLTALFCATWDLTPDLSVYVEAVHRLNVRGALITQGAHGTSREGFHAQWRMIQLLTIDGGVGQHCELFDEDNMTMALARFDELCSSAPPLANAASRTYERLWVGFSTRDWASTAETLAEDVVDDDRRHVINAGRRHGREAGIANLRAIADLGFDKMTTRVLATRGTGLALVEVGSCIRSPQPGDFSFEALVIIEIDSDDRIAEAILFEPVDVDAAFEELDVRYLAGEAAAHAPTWSVVARTYALFNRDGVGPTNWINVDHRRGTPFGSDDLGETIRTAKDLTPDLSVHVESVHRLGSHGAVVTNTSDGTSKEGLDAEWRMVQILIVDGDDIRRCELFDETDLDAALARFEELHVREQRVEGTAG